MEGSFTELEDVLLELADEDNCTEPVEVRNLLEGVVMKELLEEGVLLELADEDKSTEPEEV